MEELLETLVSSRNALIMEVYAQTLQNFKEQISNNCLLTQYIVLIPTANWDVAVEVRAKLRDCRLDPVLDMVYCSTSGGFHMKLDIPLNYHIDK